MLLTVLKEGTDEVLLVVHSVEHVPRKGDTIEGTDGVYYRVSHAHFSYQVGEITIWTE